MQCLWIVRIVTLAGLTLGTGGLGLIRDARAADWLNYRGPDYNGISKEKGWFVPGAEIKTVWKASVGDGFSAVTVRGTRLYTMGNRNGQDTVVCLDTRTGAELWKHQYPCRGGDYPGPRATPTLDGSFVYTFSLDGDLFCLDAEKGTVVWSKACKDLKLSPPRWGFASSPLVLQKTVVVNAGSHGLSLDKATGATVWNSGPGEASYATPVLGKQVGKPALVFFVAKACAAVDAETGTRLWAHPWQTSYDVHAATPLLVGTDRLFLSSGYGTGCALLKTAGSAPEAVWQNKDLNNHFSSSVLWNGHLYGIHGNTGGGDARCLDVETGAVRWSRPFGFGSLTIADGKLVILTERGELILAEAASEAYKELARAKPISGRCWTVPVVANGRIYCRSHEGNLVCLNGTGQ